MVADRPPLEVDGGEALDVGVRDHVPARQRGRRVVRLMPSNAADQASTVSARTVPLGGPASTWATMLKVAVAGGGIRGAVHSDGSRGGRRAAWYSSSRPGGSDRRTSCRGAGPRASWRSGRGRGPGSAPVPRGCDVRSVPDTGVGSGSDFVAARSAFARSPPDTPRPVPRQPDHARLVVVEVRERPAAGWGPLRLGGRVRVGEERPTGRGPRRRSR